jgi:oxygen-independent coproporphyrinogen-3 oxidase
MHTSKPAVPSQETAPLAKSYQVDRFISAAATPSYYGEKRLRELLCPASPVQRGKNDEITVVANTVSMEAGTPLRLRRRGSIAVRRDAVGRRQSAPSLHRPPHLRPGGERGGGGPVGQAKNLSLDLIYGLPGKFMASWQDKPEQDHRLKPEHRPVTASRWRRGPSCRAGARGELLPTTKPRRHVPVDSDNRLNEAGFRQYEFSNFAKRATCPATP